MRLGYRVLPLTEQQWLTVEMAEALHLADQDEMIAAFMNGDLAALQVSDCTAQQRGAAVTRHPVDPLKAILIPGPKGL